MSQKINYLSLIKFISNFKNLIIIIEKIKLRIFDVKDSITKEKNNKFLKNNASNIDHFCISLDHKLWKESLKFKLNLEKNSKTILENIQIDLGGGGAYDLIYFLSRFIRPNIVIETGVAAGFSSLSFLTAMEINQKGILFSSDFPYFRIKNPESYIGILIKKKYKNWKLYIEGDSYNINKILKQINNNIVDIIHYDSDKSYRGRNFFFKRLKKNISSNTLIIIDDIQDNSFFYDFIKSNKYLNWKIFKFKNKYLGVILPHYFTNL